MRPSTRSSARRAPSLPGCRSRFHRICCARQFSWPCSRRPAPTARPRVSSSSPRPRPKRGSSRRSLPATWTRPWPLLRPRSLPGTLSSTSTCPVSSRRPTYVSTSWGTRSTPRRAPSATDRSRERTSSSRLGRSVSTAGRCPGLTPRRSTPSFSLTANGRPTSSAMWVTATAASSTRATRASPLTKPPGSSEPVLCTLHFFLASHHRPPLSLRETHSTDEVSYGSPTNAGHACRDGHAGHHAVLLSDLRRHRDHPDVVHLEEGRLQPMAQLAQRAAGHQSHHAVCAGVHAVEGGSRGAAFIPAGVPATPVSACLVHGADLPSCGIGSNQAA